MRREDKKIRLSKEKYEKAAMDILEKQIPIDELKEVSQLDLLLRWLQKIPHSLRPLPKLSNPD
jgi:hypothetical protein